MSSTEIIFSDFWNAYGLKRDRLRAERAWNRLSVKDRQAAYAGIAPYREACQQSGISMMYAQGYLNNRRWEDEAEPQTLKLTSKSAAPKTLTSHSQPDTKPAGEQEMLLF